MTTTHTHNPVDLIITTACQKARSVSAEVTVPVSRLLAGQLTASPSMHATAIALLMIPALRSAP
jgi:hypothetical protein